MGKVLLGLMIPFWGTALGAGMVLFLKNDMSRKLENALLGFAAGVMIAASVWSLLIPSIDMAEEQGVIIWFPAVMGFLAGVLFLMLSDGWIAHLRLDRRAAGAAGGTKRRQAAGTANRAKQSRAEKGQTVREAACAQETVCVQQNRRERLRRGTLLVFAITLHNIPEGLAVGVVFAEALQRGAGAHLARAFTLALGIAIQNFPEGAIVSMPLRSEGCSKGKAFFFGMLSGAVEPVAAFLAILLTRFVTPLLPYCLSFAAGAMICVVTEELIPQSQGGEGTNAGTIGAAAGFALMMFLDVALG